MVVTNLAGSKSRTLDIRRIRNGGPGGIHTTSGEISKVRENVALKQIELLTLAQVCLPASAPCEDLFFK